MRDCLTTGGGSGSWSTGRGIADMMRVLLATSTKLCVDFAAQSDRVTDEQQYDPTPHRRRRRLDSTQRIEKYERGFEEITRRARGRFERRDWSGAQADATERLALYKAHVDAAVADVHDILEDAVMERTVWAAMKSDHALRTDGRPDAELAETFFNSVTRRVFSTVGVDPAIEYLDRTPSPPAADDRTILDIYQCSVAMRCRSWSARSWLRIPWSVPYAQLDRDAVLVAELIDARSSLGAGRAGSDRARPRCARCSTATRAPIWWAASGPAHEIIPLVLPLLHAERGHRGGRSVDDLGRGQRGLRVQLDLLPGRLAPTARTGRLPRVHHAAQAGA